MKNQYQFLEGHILKCSLGFWGCMLKCSLDYMLMRYNTLFLVKMNCFFFWFRYRQYRRVLEEARCCPCCCSSWVILDDHLFLYWLLLVPLFLVIIISIVTYGLPFWIIAACLGRTCYWRRKRCRKLEQVNWYKYSN